jgi:hypothetical protein
VKIVVLDDYQRPSSTGGTGTEDHLGVPDQAGGQVQAAALPRRIARSTPSSACVVPNRLRRPSARTTRSLMMFSVLPSRAVPCSAARRGADWRGRLASAAHAAGTLPAAR